VNRTRRTMSLISTPSPSLRWGRLYKLNPVDPHILKAPGFNPYALNVISWFQILLSDSTCVPLLCGGTHHIIDTISPAGRRRRWKLHERRERHGWRRGGVRGRRRGRSRRRHVIDGHSSKPDGGG
jgi:hypothetical protein